MSGFADRVTGIGLLAEPVRRELYLYVCTQPHPVGREEAADAVGVPHHKAKFHLDKLAGEGLLVAEFARLTGRTGPGSGRPSKLYRRSADEVAVSLPDREYELAGRLMAEAIAASARSGGSAIAALSAAAAERGRTWAAEARAGAPVERSLDIACRALAEHGYEPRIDRDRVTLANCPFHSLSASHTEMVCGMNLALVDALVTAVDGATLRCRLDPGDGRCCVVIDAAEPTSS
ncbi:transcriptional regulator [Nocardioides sp.]|uniref:helix-turn-helix transcriptional regulator n=1 Tax=Nocardioides sp. TaxID=35761 RepID=UPI0031FF0233|nr:transcriptional regulator [Nocardioides sp.]